MGQLVINANDIINMVEDIKVHDLKMTVDFRSTKKNSAISLGKLGNLEFSYVWPF